jgi:hypothetical protein
LNTGIGAKRVEVLDREGELGDTLLIVGTIISSDRDFKDGAFSRGKVGTTIDVIASESSIISTGG